MHQDTRKVFLGGERPRSFAACFKVRVATWHRELFALTSTLKGYEVAIGSFMTPEDDFDKYVLLG